LHEKKFLVNGTNPVEGIWNSIKLLSSRQKIKE